jgi:chorismate mutase/prephenate dehydratase
LVKVAYYGDVGSYSEEASLKFFKHAELRPCRRFKDVFNYVVGEEVDSGVVPIENSLEGINLTKIESRPKKEVLWEYIFFIDFEGHRLDSKCLEALNALRNYVPFMKVLGSYLKAT